jgi:hypothetical protein
MGGSPWLAAGPIILCVIQVSRHSCVLSGRPIEERQEIAESINSTVFVEISIVPSGEMTDHVKGISERASV